MGVGVTDTLRAVHVRVTGRVQHVGFRWFVARAARDLGISGCVRNAADGSLEVDAFGAAEHVERLLDALRRGPPQAVVQSVEIDERPSPAAAVNPAFEIFP